MSHTFRVALCLFSFVIFGPAPARSQTVRVSHTPPEAKELAASLVRAGSKDEQESLLASVGGSHEGALLDALKKLAEPLVQKGDYDEAIRVSKLAVRVAERGGDPLRLANALCDLGSV